MTSATSTWFGRHHENWVRFKHSKTALVGTAIVVSFIFLAIFGDSLAPQPPLSDQALMQGQAGLPPSLKYPFGTSQAGLNIFSDCLHAVRNDLVIGIGAAIIAITIAVTVGLASGYFGGYIDDALMRGVELFLFFPIILMLLLVTRILTLFLTGGYGIWLLILVIGIFTWPTSGRVIRGEAMRIMKMDFVNAQRMIGSGHFRVMFRHLMPNVMGQILVLATLTIGNAILIESGVYFLGFGTANTDTWGFLIYDNIPYLLVEWWGVVFPGLMIALAVLGFNLLGDGLNEVLNPSLGG